MIKTCKKPHSCHAMTIKNITERYIIHVQLLLEYYTDISCLEGVFVKNTSREKISRAEWRTWIIYLSVIFLIVIAWHECGFYH
jgi:hypothetical protein